MSKSRGGGGGVGCQEQEDDGWSQVISTPAPSAPPRPPGLPGVEDDGYPKGLEPRELESSAATLMTMASSLSASVRLVRHLPGAFGRLAALYHVTANRVDDLRYTDLRVSGRLWQAVAGLGNQNTLLRRPIGLSIGLVGLVPVIANKVIRIPVVYCFIVYIG